MRAARVVAGALLLVTCSSDSAIAPTIPVRAEMDLSGLFRAGGQIPIPVDEVLVELRRTSDSSVAFSRVLSAAEFSQRADSLIVRVDLDLRATTEQFYLYAEARGGGVVYYSVRSTVTASAGATSPTAPLTPTYVGPGNSADSVRLTIAPSSLIAGDSVLVTALVYDNDAVLPGVPVGILSSDTTLVRPREAGLNQAWLVTPSGGSGTIMVTALTPTSLTHTGMLSWTAAPVVATVTVLPANPSVQVNQTVQLSATARDANSNVITGLPESWSSNATGFATVVAGTGLVTGVSPGSATITATIGGVSGSTVVTVVGAGGPASVAAQSTVTQNVTVNQLVSAPPSVIVRDASNQPLAGVTVTFAVTAGGGSLTGATQTTNAGGIATVGSWRAGQTAGTNTVTATVAALTPVSFTATGTATAPASLVIISGNNQSDSAGMTLPQPLVIEVRDTFSNVVPAVTVNWAVTDGSIAPTSGPSDAAGRAQATWTLGQAQASPTATASVGSVQTTFSATTLFSQPVILLSFAGIPGVGVGLTADVNVTLNQPAPAGGAAVTLSSTNTGVFTVSPGVVNIPQGQTAGLATITGVSPGTATLDATSPGIAAGALSVDVQNRNISVPPTLNVPYGQTASLPIQIPAPAPAGGVTFSVTSSNPGNVSVAVSSVTIPAGGQTANATLNGVLPGPATITVSNQAYIDGVTSAATSASINIVQTSASLNASFGTTISFNFESNGTPTAAPAPGITVTLTPADANCVAATSPVTIATGLVSGTSTLTYGGQATLPCTTQLVASAPNLQSDSINVTVAAAPGISVNPATVGSGLQTSTSFFLGAGNHGGVSVTLTSADPAVLLSPNATTAGTGQITMAVANGVQSVGFYIQGLEGQTQAVPSVVTVSAPGFSNGTGTMTVVQAGITVNGLPGTTTTLSASNPIYAYVGVPSGNGLSTVQNLRVGGPGNLTVTFGTPGGAGDLLKAATAPSDTQTAQIVPGTYYTPFDTTSGGVAFHPLQAGSTTVSVAAAGYLSTPNATASVTVSQPGISASAVTVGSGLQTSTSFFLGAGAHGGVNVTLTSADPAVLLSPNATTAGTSQITMAVANGVQSVSFFVQGLEGQTQAVPSLVTVSAPGFSNGTATMTVVQAGITVNGLPGTTTTLSASNPIYAYVGVPSGNGLSTVQNLRVGGPGNLTVTFGTPGGAGDLLKAATAPSDTQTAQIVPGTYYTPFDTTSGGVAFHPLTAGSTTVSVSAVGYLSTPNATASVTVSQPGISVNAATVGSGLQTSTSFFLGAGAHGGVSVTLTSADPAVLLSPNATTAGTSQITIPVANGVQSVGFYIQGLEGQTQAVPSLVTVSAPGFSNGTATMTVVQAGITVNGLPGTTTTLSPSNAVYAYVGVPSGNGLSTVQNLRVGGPGNLTVTFTSPAGVGELLKAATPPGASQTAQIVPGTYYTPFDTTSGGVAFHPLLSGSTTVSVAAAGYLATPNATASVTVSQPGISVNAVTVGSGLQTNTSFFLGASTHGGVTVTLTSSNAAMLLSPNATTAGSSQITMAVPNGTQSVGFYVQGLEGQTQSVTTTVTVSASGFTDGTASITVVQAGITVNGLPGTTTLLSPSNPVYAYVGVPSGNGLSTVQNLRVGGPGNLTVTFTSPPGVGELLKAATAPGGTQTAQIVPGTYYTPFDTSTGGVAFHPLQAGTTTVSVAAAGYLTTPNATASVTVSTPGISVNPTTVGSGLQTSTSFFLGGSAHGGVTVTLTSGNAALLLSPNATTAGASQITIAVPNGTQSVGFFIQGLEGQTQGLTTSVTVSAPGFTNGTGSMTVVQSGVQLAGVPATIASTAPVADIYAYVGIPSGNGVSVQNVRFGGPGNVTVTFTSGNVSAASLVTAAQPTGAATQTAQIVPGTYYTPFSVATQGAGLQPVAPGTSVISTSIPGYISTVAAAQSVTVQ